MIARYVKAPKIDGPLSTASTKIGVLAAPVAQHYAAIGCLEDDGRLGDAGRRYTRLRLLSAMVMLLGIRGRRRAHRSRHASPLAVKADISKSARR